MALVLRSVYQFYEYYFREFNDPRVEKYPLVHSPFPVLAIIGLYLGYVLKWGPEWMEDRKPFNLKSIIKWYNLFQVIYNLVLVVYALPNSYLQKDFSLFCQLHDLTNNKPYMQHLIFAAYLYYISKYIDLLDTIFFVLRKKNKQITFLHVYHHAGMVFGVYCYVKFLSGSHATMTGVINGFVHVIMYGYYFLTALDGNARKYDWCKKYVTQIQLAQFGYLIIHFLMPLFNSQCDVPLFVCTMGVIQHLFMFVLFFDFYIKTYIKKKKVQ